MKKDITKKKRTILFLSISFFFLDHKSYAYLYDDVIFQSFTQSPDSIALGVSSYSMEVGGAGSYFNPAIPYKRSQVELNYGFASKSFQSVDTNFTGILRENEISYYASFALYFVDPIYFINTTVAQNKNKATSSEINPYSLMSTESPYPVDVESFYAASDNKVNLIGSLEGTFSFSYRLDETSYLGIGSSYYLSFLPEYNLEVSSGADYIGHKGVYQKLKVSIQYIVDFWKMRFGIGVSNLGFDSFHSNKASADNESLEDSYFGFVYPNLNLALAYQVKNDFGQNILNVGLAWKQSTYGLENSIQSQIGLGAHFLVLSFGQNNPYTTLIPEEDPIGGVFLNIGFEFGTYNRLSTGISVDYHQYNFGLAFIFPNVYIESPILYLSTAYAF